MAEIPRSSFIPKQSGSAIPATMQRRKNFSVFNFLASVILVASLAVAGGSYFYKGITQKRLDGAKQSLIDEKRKFGDEKLNEVRDFNRQLLAVKFLLDQHIAPTKIFKVLEFATMQRIQFNNFKFEYDPVVGDALVTVQGGTEEFKTVALQAMKFGDQPILNEVMFSELGSSDVSSDSVEEGNQKESDPQAVVFTVTGIIPLNLLQYDGQYEVQIEQDQTAETTEAGENIE